MTVCEPKHKRVAPKAVWHRKLVIGSVWVVHSTIDPRGVIVSLESMRPMTFVDEEGRSFVVRWSSKTRWLSGPFESRDQASIFRRAR